MSATLDAVFAGLDSVEPFRNFAFLPESPPSVEPFRRKSPPFARPLRAGLDDASFGDLFAQDWMQEPASAASLPKKSLKSKRVLDHAVPRTPPVKSNTWNYQGSSSSDPPPSPGFVTVSRNRQKSIFKVLLSLGHSAEKVVNARGMVEDEVGCGLQQHSCGIRRRSSTKLRKCVEGFV